MTAVATNKILDNMALLQRGQTVMHNRLMKTEKALAKANEVNFFIKCCEKKSFTFATLPVAYITII